MLLHYARAENDIVLVGSSPVLRGVNPLHIVRVTEGVVLVMSEKSASPNGADVAVGRSLDAGAPVADVVAAGDPKRMPGRYACGGCDAAESPAG